MAAQRSLTSAMAWMFTGSWAEQAINLTAFVILAYLLGAEAFGLATMALVFVLFAEFIVRQTITEAIIKIEKLEDGHLDVIFWSLGTLSILLTALLILSANAIAAIYSNPQIADYLIWATPTIIIIGFSGVPINLLNRELEFRALAIRATIGVLAGSIAGITLALLDFGVWCFIAQRVVQIFTDHLLAWTARPWRPGFRAKRRHLDDVIGFSSRLMGLRISELISINAPLVIIGAYFGPTMLGLYALGWRLVETLSFLITIPIKAVAQPAFASIKRAKGQVDDLLIKILGTSSLITFVAFAGMASVSALTITFLFGADWLDAISTHQILCLAGIYFSIERIQQVFCLALGHASALLKLSILEALVGIAAMLWSVQYGLIGVAIAFVARYYLLWPLRFLILSRYTEKSAIHYIRAFSMPLAAAILTALIVIGWQQWLPAEIPVFIQLLSSIMVGVISYLAIVWFTIRTRCQELILAINSLKGPGH